jgi:hypothetical protein
MARREGKCNETLTARQLCAIGFEDGWHLAPTDVHRLPLGAGAGPFNLNRNIATQFVCAQPLLCSQGSTLRERLMRLPCKSRRAQGFLVNDVTL